MTKGRRLTDAAGNVTSAVVTDPFGGEVTAATWSLNSPRQPRKFTTYGRDSDASDEAGHRRYRPSWGRFDQPDPADFSYDPADPQSLNRYAYVSNDPVNFTDPAGLYWIFWNLSQYGAAYGFGGWGSATGNVDQSLHFRETGETGRDIIIEGEKEFDWWASEAVGWPGEIGINELLGLQIHAGILRNQVAALLESGDCAGYVTDLLNKLAADHPLHGDTAFTDPLKLFDAIAGQGGFVNLPYLSLRDNKGQMQPALGTARGWISRGNATVYVAAQMGSWAHISLHEMIHLAGKYQMYQEQWVAEAARKLGGPELKASQDVFDYSRYWNTELGKHCPGGSR